MSSHTDYNNLFPRQYIYIEYTSYKTSLHGHYTRMRWHIGENHPLLIFEQPQPELLQCKVQRGLSYGHYKTPVIYKLFSITWCYRMHNSNTCRFCSILTPDNSSCYTNKVGLGLDLTQTFLSNFWCRNRASIAVQPKKTMSQQRRNCPTEKRDSGHKTCHYESAVI